MSEDADLKTTTQKLRFVWHETFYYTYRVLRLWVTLFALVIAGFYGIVALPLFVFPSNGGTSLSIIQIFGAFLTLVVLGTGVLLLSQNLAVHKHEIDISADPRYPDSEIQELAHEFESVFQVHTAKYERFGLPEYALILLIIFGDIPRGFFEAIGKNIWESLKKKLASTVSNQKEVSEVEFHYNYGPKKVELMVRSSEGNVVASAFDQIQNTLETVEKSQADAIYCEFDSSLNKWVPISQVTYSEQKVAFRFENCVVATVKSVTVRGHTYHLTEENLKELAKTFAGHYLKYEHSGPPIGRVDKAWYENGKLMVSGVAYEARDDKGRAILESIKKGELKGLSIGFSFESKRK